MSVPPLSSFLIATSSRPNCFALILPPFQCTKPAMQDNAAFAFCSWLLIEKGYCSGPLRMACRIATQRSNDADTGLAGRTFPRTLHCSCYYCIAVIQAPPRHRPPRLTSGSSIKWSDCHLQLARFPLPGPVPASLSTTRLCSTCSVLFSSTSGLGDDLFSLALRGARRFIHGGSLSSTRD